MTALQEKLIRHLEQKMRDGARGICGPGLQLSEPEIGQILRATNLVAKPAVVEPFPWLRCQNPACELMSACADTANCATKP